MEIERNSALLSLRPKIKTEFWNELELERFQNEVLRPILKFQNEIVLAFTVDDIKSTVKDFFEIRERNQIQHINSWFSQKQNFKTGIVCLVVALFNLDEMKLYTENKKEINKRINAMALQRVLDGYLDFIKVA
jgi:hypothetical protein